MSRYKYYEVKKYQARLRTTAHKSDLELFDRFVGELAACHSSGERVIDLVGLIISKWSVLKNQFVC